MQISGSLRANARELRLPSTSWSSQRPRRRAGVNIQPSLFTRGKHCGYSYVCGELLVLVGGGEFGVGDLEYGATHTTVVSTVERDISMLCLAACGHDLRFVDSHPRWLEPRKLISLPLEQSSERG